jgi:hypothetical protein
VPLALFLVVLIILYLFSPERVQARIPTGETTVDTVDARGDRGVFLGLGAVFRPGGVGDPSREGLRPAGKLLVGTIGEGPETQPPAPLRHLA